VSIQMRATALIALCSLVLAAAAGAEPRPTTYVLPGNPIFPEGVAFQQSTGNYFVSSTADGTIFRGHVSEQNASVFLPGTATRTTAIGLEVDGDRLYIAGGPTGRIFVNSIGTGAQLASFETGTGGFLNDIATAKSGDAFVTDSQRPILWRVSADLSTVEPWLNFTGTPAAYTPGFNLNGIVATPDGKYLIVSKSNTNELFRIDLATKEVVEIVTDAPTGGDGLQLQGHTLYAVDDGGILEVQLSGDYTSGDVIGLTVDPSFRSPTTNAIARGRMLVVNSQFAARPTMTQVLPFTVSSVAIP
jgi:Cu-Zn family superoxide dismutase